jgi:hypothetical protein
MSLVTTPGNLPTLGGCDSLLLKIRRYGSSMPYVFDLQFQGGHTLVVVEHPKNNLRITQVSVQDYHFN